MLDGLTEISSRRFNVLPHTLRSTAILHRLYVVVTINRISESNGELVELFERLERTAIGNM